MTDIDLSRLPSGARGWAALVEWAAASDDSQERYFLELKSEVDLSTKHGWHKVAKFILGAANRDPVKAAKRFGGYAVMLVGIGNGMASGIALFEAKDLEREVKKFTGAEGPSWDYEQIPVADGRAVIAIIVDPPTGRIWPSLADGQGLFNGDVYLRGDGKTEKATGGELQAMLARAVTSSAPSTLPAIAVETLGEVLAVRFDRGRLLTYVEDTAQDYLRDADEPERAPWPGLQISQANLMERRSKDEFARQVTRWREAAEAAPESGLSDLAARFAVCVRLRLTNTEKISLRDVRVDLQFDDPVRALDWEDGDEDAHAELFPERPMAWGRDSLASLLGRNPIGPFTSRDSNGVLRITQSSPARFSLSLNLLHAKETFVSEEDDVVLVAFVESELRGPITGRWTLTAGDVNDILEGGVTVPVDYRDWVTAIAMLVSDDLEEDDPEQKIESDA